MQLQFSQEDSGDNFVNKRERLSSWWHTIRVAHRLDHGQKMTGTLHGNGFRALALTDLGGTPMAEKRSQFHAVFWLNLAQLHVGAPGGLAPLLGGNLGSARVLNQTMSNHDATLVHRNGHYCINKTI